jgi:cytoskeleton protein RodZ
MSGTEGYSEIGTLLRSAREETRLSIDQAARTLHIRVRYLDALEEGRLSELPGLTYTRGYLQAYASFLGLDRDEILRRFEEVESALARKNFYFPQVFSKEKTPNRWLIWGGLALAVLAYVFWARMLHPQMPRISVVEAIQEEPVKKSPVVADNDKDVACLQAQDGYYPPCIWDKEPVFNLIPLHYQINSVMELRISEPE